VRVGGAVPLAAAAPPRSPAATALDLQFFVGALAGAAPPGILFSAVPAQPFRVDNETFVRPNPVFYFTVLGVCC
jgi:hypothetical protein